MASGFFDSIFGSKDGAEGEIYYRRRQRFEDPKATDEIWVMDAEGKNKRRITDNAIEEVGPAVSPDGRFLAYADLKREGEAPDWIYTGYLVIQTTATGEEKRVPYRAGIPRIDITWASDGKRLALVEGMPTGINIVDLDGKTLRRIDKTGNEWSPSFSPTGQDIAYDRFGIIYVNGNEIVTDGHPVGNSKSPIWSPGGDRILFVSDRNQRGVYQMYVTDPDGENQRMLVSDGFDPLVIGHPPGTWSPDGTQVAFKTRECDAIHVVDVDTGKRRPVIENKLLSSQIHPVHWSPDGEHLASEGWNHYPGYAIFTIPANGKGRPDILTEKPLHESVVAYR